MPRRAGATQEEMRRHNLSTLLRLVHVHGAASRSELTSVTGLSRSTIKSLVAALVSARLVTEEIPATREGAGRPSHVVLPRTGSAYVLGANVGVDAVRVASVGLGGRVLARHEYRMGPERARPEAVAGRLATELRRLQSRAPTEGWVAGVGVGIPGIVRRSDGYVELAPNLTWRGVAFRQMLVERLGLPVGVRVANDGEVGAIAEHVRGVGRGVSSMIYIAGEVGVGGGVVVDGHMLLGAGGYAGEIGHMIVNPEGRRCRCGSSGCLETEVGEDALLRAAGREPGGGRAALEEVLADARAGEARAVEAVEHVALWLARGVANLVNVFNPELVVFGGPLSAVYSATEALVHREVARLALDASWPRARLAEPALGDDSMVLGAAELAFETLLADPLGSLREDRA